MKNLISLEEQQKIQHFCRHNNIINYTIKSDGSIDVVGSVSLDFMSPDIEELPVIFNSVSKSFACSDSGLTSMSGFPKTVGGNFLCNNNLIKTIQGGPHTVNGDYILQYTDIINLIGCAHTIGGDFSLYGSHHLTSLYSDVDICIEGTIITDGVSLPVEIDVENNDSQLKIILKYQRHFEIWNDDFSLNTEKYQILIDDIKDGLE